MFARRDGSRFNRGRVAARGGSAGPAPPGPTDLLTIVTSRTCLCYLVGDVGAGANQWSDQSGNAVHFTEATNPPVAAAQSDINNRVAYDSNGTSQLLTNAGFNFASSRWVLTIFKPDAWTSGARIWGSVTGVTGASLVQNPTASPNMRCQSGSNGPTNTGAVAATWTRARTLFTQSTSDLLRLAATQTTGTNTSSAYGTGRQLFAHNGASFSNCKIALWAVWNGEPSAGELTAIDTWVTNYYGSGVAVG